MGGGRGERLSDCASEGPTRWVVVRTPVCHRPFIDAPPVADLDDDALIGLSRGFEETQAAVAAQQHAVFAELARRRVAAAVPLTIARAGSGEYEEELGQAQDRELAWCAAEFAAELRVSQVTMGQRMAEAIALQDGLPAVWQALAAGRITVSKARVFLKGLAVLDPDTAIAVADKLLP